MYDVIVLGATFAAAGIACVQKEKCLVLERRVQAGYEFFGALQYGSGYEKEMKRKEALSLRQSFLQDSTGAYDRNTYIYPYFAQAHILFGTQVVSVEKTDEGFVCLTHGADGFRSYKAKKVVDTRCSAEMSRSKTYNLLIESEDEPAYADVHCEKAGGENRYILRCPVPLSCGYVEARSIAKKVIEGFPENRRLILSADEFDYRVKEGYPKTEGGIVYLPSKAYEKPIFAFEAGLAVAEEADK